MSTIYIVTSGSYSDYGIRGVYTTREAAQQFCDDINSIAGRCFDDYEIEEWEADAPREDRGPGWEVALDANGNVVWSSLDELNIPGIAPKVETRVWHNGQWTAGLRVTGYGITEEHARRSAEEARRQHIALHGK